LNSGAALIADVTGRGAELVRAVASGGVTGIACRVSGAGSHWQRSIDQITLGGQAVPWGITMDPEDPPGEGVLLDLIDRGADFVVMPADTFPAWGLDVLESFPKVGRVISVPHDLSGEVIQAMETLGPQAIVVRMGEEGLTIGALSRARIVVESVGVRVLAWAPSITSRDTRMLRQVGFGGCVVDVGAEDPERVLGRLHELVSVLAEPVLLRRPLT